MKPIRRVLVVQPYGLGDLLFITPVLRALRLLPTVEKVDLLLGSRTEEIGRNNPHVDEIFSIDKDLFHRRGGFQNFQEILALGKRLRHVRYDLLLDYSLRGEYAFMSRFFLGIPRRAGFAYKNRAFFHNIRFPLAEGFKDRHVLDYDCDLAEAAGVPVDDRFMEFYRDPGGFEHPPFSHFIAVAPCGGESWGKDAHFRRWPLRFFAELIERLSGKVDFEGVCIFGSSREKDRADEFKSLLNVPSLNLAGELSLQRSAALLEQARLFIVNDSGLVHLAHAREVPLIAFYGPVDPAIYGPYPPSENALAITKEGLACRPCYKRFRYNSACVGRECLQDLTVDEVWNTIASSGFLSNMEARLKRPLTQAN